MKWLNYQHLQYFWYIVRCGGVSKAAQRLRLAQPTISAQLKLLEQSLGSPLLERGRLGVRLTETGQIALRYAEQIFGLGQEFLDVIDGRVEGVSTQHLRIGIADVVPKSVAYRLIRPAFIRRGPALVSCLEDKPERLLAELAIGGIDIVISDRPIPPTVRVKAFNHFVGDSAVCFLAAPQIARKLRRGFPRTLHGAPLLLPTDEAAVRRELDRWFHQQSLHPFVVAEFQDRALMKLAARDGQGVLVVPAVVEHEVKEEFSLSLVGTTAAVREELYLISLERRLKNPLLLSVWQEGTRDLFGSRGQNRKRPRKSHSQNSQ